MRQTTIWDFLPQESSTEAKSTNQRNTMKFKSLEDVFFEYLRMNQPNSDLVGIEQPIEPDAEHNSDYCIDCQLAELESKESLLLASVNVNILEVIQNTLNQDSNITPQQSETLIRLGQLRSLLGNG